MSVTDATATGTLPGRIVSKINEGCESSSVKEATGAEFQVRAGEDGRFRLQVPGGAHTIAATCEAFEPQGPPHVNVPWSGRATFDTILRLPVLGEVIIIPALPKDAAALAKSADLPLEQPPRGGARW